MPRVQSILVGPEGEKEGMRARFVSITAASIAIVFIFVRVIQVPIPATGGFTHIGAVAEIFIALAFGPIVGLIAAGVGAALADLSLGFGQFAPLTLLAHGSLGVLAGYIGWAKSSGRMVIAWLAGGAALVLIYFAGEWLIPSLYGGPAAAVVELPANIFQVSLGVLGLLLLRLTKAAYPQIDRLAEEVSFEEV